MKAEKIVYNFLMTKDDMMHMIVSMNQVYFLMKYGKEKKSFWIQKINLLLERNFI